MQTIKTTVFLSLLFLTSLISCDNNDDAQTDPITPTDGFTHNGTFFETPNAYIEIDEDDNNNDGFPDDYNFFFSNGRMFDNDANVNGSSGDYLFSLNTTNWVFYNLTTDINPSLLNSAPQAGNSYYGSSNDSVIIENGQINALSPPFFDNGIEFGMGGNVGFANTPGSIGPSITINAINLDTNNPSASTIDVDYTFLNQNGDTITGHYEGTLGIILD